MKWISPELVKVISSVLVKKILHLTPGIYKSTTREVHPKLQPVNSFIVELKHFLRCRVGIRTEYLGVYAAWIAFKSSVREGEVEERIGLPESYCFQTKASFKIKDRYCVG